MTMHRATALLLTIGARASGCTLHFAATSLLTILIVSFVPAKQSPSTFFPLKTAQLLFSLYVAWIGHSVTEASAMELVSAYDIMPI